MKIGRISEPILKRSVLKTIHYKNKNVITGAKVGMDAAIVNMADAVSTSTAGMMLDKENFLFDCVLAIHSAVNNIAATGCNPFAAILSLMLPEAYMESDLKNIMKCIHTECEKYMIQIAGGDTKVSRNLNTPIAVVTVLGKKYEWNQNEKLWKQSSSLNKDIFSGMDIVMSKHIAISGTRILLLEKQEKLLEYFQKSYLDLAKRNCTNMSVLEESKIAVKYGVSAMHDISHGGIFAGLWELGEQINMGLEADIDKIEIKQETIEICEKFGINPYLLQSDGALLMVHSDGNGLVRELESKGIHAKVIGKITDSHDKIVVKNEEKRYLEPPKDNELNKIMNNISH